MAVIEGVVASALMDRDHSVITIYPIHNAPSRRIAPEGAIDLILRREVWQTDEGHRDHVQHMIGRPGIIEYEEGDTPLIAAIRTH